MKRVVVTGMGAITPIGNSVETFWNSLKENKVGIGLLDRFDNSAYKVKLAAQVKDFDPLATMEAKEAKRMELFSQYAVAASAEAIADAGLDLEKEDLTRIGVSVGCGIGSLQILETAHTKLVDRGPGRVPPLLVPLMISNMAAGNVGIHFGLKGKCINVVTACATGTHSIGEAFRGIQCGDMDVCVAGGTEAAICPIGIAGFGALTALSTATDPLRGSLPFDKDRSGFVMGEGAGVVILESYEHAAARGAKILAEVGGYGATCDAYHITSPAEDGEGAARAMTLAITEGGLTPADVAYVNAHGTGTHHNDLYETRAIKKAFGKDAYQLNVNSTKSMTGHMLGAAGAVEFIVCVKTIQEGFIHATAGFRSAEEEMDLNYTPQAVKRQVRAAVTNSLGFGGHNGSLLVKKFED
ncbi:MAG TPA: beta-ketoacyl-ACP synthase II [Candidatus Merdiplasma excrementigallinarum]|uniref:3-oxoacyl-[acyl-carrier-protein] synthase 2 n=1 Tax=Candidatus Merdiplasma excrementigallinarum TaxID=2840864 RepID=A0A9D1NZT0_9FIRM|nr:beta-ketoacyl-ACP synthase II [Candidatus Merdiplasma excrementigallinarum]